MDGGTSANAAVSPDGIDEQKEANAKDATAGEVALIEEGPALKPEEVALGNVIDDKYFIKELKRVKNLRTFLLQQAVRIEPDTEKLVSFGKLNHLRYNRSGRVPTDAEWDHLERLTPALFGRLSEPLRQRFVLGGIPVWTAMLPILLAFVALFFLVVGVACATEYVQDIKDKVLGDATSMRAIIAVCYLFWLISLGALGSIAFIGMNALSIQTDVTFDLTNTRLVFFRLVLGALFALVITLPFGFGGFLQFLQDLVTIRQDSGGSNNPQDLSVTQQSLLLLLPFALGFSTSLVLTIFNRLVSGVHAFFGNNESEGQRPLGKPPHTIQDKREADGT